MVIKIPFPQFSLVIVSQWCLTVHYPPSRLSNFWKLSLVFASIYHRCLLRIYLEIMNVEHLPCVHCLFHLPSKYRWAFPKDWS